LRMWASWGRRGGLRDVSFELDTPQSFGITVGHADPMNVYFQARGVRKSIKGRRNHPRSAIGVVTGSRPVPGI